MPKKYDLTGQRFGRLTALYIVPNNNHHTRWHCVCDCGKTKDVLQQNLSNGHVRSCGCLLTESNSKKIAALNFSMNRESHNETRTRLYRIWVGIKSRCCRASSAGYRNYGGRGISVCDEWKDSFLAFKSWSIANGYNETLSIDRIDVNGDYSPANCRWATPSVQQFNKRKSERNTSGHVGVSWNKKQQRWVAYITKDKVLHYIGSFVSLDDAIAARAAAVLELYR